jgi:hypothetical protein
MTENEIQLLISFNIPDNNQQLVTPSKVREVLNAILSYATNQQIVIPDDLQVVTDRGADTTKTITVGGVRVRFGVFRGNFNVPELTENRQWTLRDMDGTIAFLSDITGGPGGVPTLEQVLQQGSEADVDAGDGHTFIARLPYIDPNGVDKTFNLVMSYENAGTTFSSGLYGEAGFTQLNAQFGDANSSRAAQLALPIPSPTEGEFNNLLNIILQRIVSGTLVNSYYNVSYPTPVEGTSIVIRFPHILTSGIYDLATQQWASALLANKADLVGGLVPASQLPGFVDDVLEFANLAAFPVTGESGKLYVALDTNKTYRWSGSTYVALDEGVALGETSSTAYRGDRGKMAYDHSQTSGNPHGTTAAQIGAYSISQVNTLLSNKANSFIVTDRSLTSTIIGCGSFVTRRITEIDCGNFVIVDFDFDGVGTATTFTFTLSFNASVRNSAFIARRNNNATFVQGAARTSPGSNVITLFQDINNSAWTASGNRTAFGQIIVLK